MIAKVFAFGKVSAVVGYPYTSKTPMALDIAIGVAAGLHAKQIKVLYLATEGARNARRKAARIAKAKGLTLDELAPWLQIAYAPSGFLNAESAAVLINSLRADGYGALFLDTYGSALDGSIDRNSNAFSDCLKQLGDASDAFNLLFVVLLHCRKDKMRGGKPPTLQDIDGHNSVAGAIQGAVALSRPVENDKALIEVSCLRAPDEEFPTYYVRWEDGDEPLGALQSLSAEPAELPASAGAVDPREKVNAEAFTVQQILELLQGGNTTTLRHIEKGLSTGLGREAKAAVVLRLQREGVLTVKAIPNGSQVVALAPRTPRSAEALAKRTGFLAGK